MKFAAKIIVLAIFTIMALPAFSESINDTKPIECGVTFDWITKTQLQRDEKITQIQKILFNNDTVLKYPSKQFKSQYVANLKDNDYVEHYQLVSYGKKEDAGHYYAGFFLQNGLLIAYGVQNKNDLKHIYYYDAMGHLRFVDIYSETYPKFPYYALQYEMSGKLAGTIYFVSQDDQYIFNPDKTFKGLWYKEKMYNRNAKVILTRSNW